MNVITLLQSTAYIPSLASRPFLAAFLVALLAAVNPIYGTDLQPESLWGFQAVPTAPAWFISPVSLFILGILATTEILARKFEEARLILDEVDGIIKGVVTLVVSFALVDPETAALLRVASDAGPLSILSFMWSGFVSTIVWFVAYIRAGFFRLLSELDEDDDLGLQGALSWLEDMGVSFGVLLATFLPLIALGLSGLVILSLWLLQRYFDHREAQNRMPCLICRQPIHPAALTCHHCGQANQSPHQIGVFGQTKGQLATSRTKHRLQLLVRKRCPQCATRLPKKALQQTCPTCQTVTFANAQAVEAYIYNLQPALGQTLIICFILGLIPVIGLIPGLIYYRLSLISSLRRYIPRRTGFLVRWLIRLLNMVLMMLQPVPVLGAFMLPILCYSNFVIYQGVLRREQKHVRPLARAKLKRPTSGNHLLKELY